MASGCMFNLFVGQWDEQQNIYQEMCCRLMDLEPQWPLGRYFEVVKCAVGVPYTYDDHCAICE